MDRVNLGRNAVFVATEVDQPISLLVSTTAMSRRDFALVIPAPGLALALEQLFRRLALGCHVSEIADTRPAPSRRRRFVSPDAHVFIPRKLKRNVL